MADESLTDRIYEAALVPEQWRDVLGAFARLAGAKDATLIATRGVCFSGWLSSSVEFDEIVEAHSNRYANNLRTSRLIAAQHTGFLQDRDVMTADELNREPIYQEFLIPKGYGSGVATAIFSTSGDNIIVHAEYGHTRGPERAGLIAELDQLRPHFARAALLSSRLGLERARAMTEAMRIVGLPGAVLREPGKLVAANPEFEVLLPEMFQDRHDRLHIADEEADTLLANALARLPLRAPTAGVNSIPVAASEGRLPHIVHVLPVRGLANDLFTQAVALLIVTPVDRAAVLTAGILQGLFDLTPAEARVARAIGEAHSVEWIAESLSVSRETVRTQLKSVLSKTGVGRQVELVRLLAGASRLF